MRNAHHHEPPHLTPVQVRIEHYDEVYFQTAYFDNFSQTWRDPETDNVIQGVKSWGLDI